MNIIVCIKQVPNTNEVRVNQETGTLMREGVPSIINPDDQNALEAALELKDQYGGKVTAITMGPYQSTVILREALAMGCDKGILLSDRSFAGSDTWATSTILAAAIEKIHDFDVIFCGRQAIDGDTAQVGPETAEFLNISQVTYGKHIEIKEGNAVITRHTEEGDYVIQSQLPVLITAIKELNEPRLPSVKGIYRAFDEGLIETWSLKELQVDSTQIGLKASPTNVYKTFVPVKVKNNKIYEEMNVKDSVNSLMGELMKLNLIERN